MPIKASCECGHSFEAPSKYAGQKVKCPKCKQPLKIPAKKAAAGSAGAAAKPSKITVKCKCGKAFAAKAELAGKKVKCPGCGDPVVIPAKGGAGKSAKKSAAPKQAAPAKQPNAEMAELFDEVGFNPEDGSAAKKCPECRASMRDEAIICIECGYNETTGKVMKTYRPVTQEERKKRLEKDDKPTGGAKGSGKKSNSTMLLVVAVVVIAAAGVAWYFLMGPGAAAG